MRRRWRAPRLVDCEFVVTGCDAAKVFEAAECGLHAPAVDHRLKRLFAYVLALAKGSVGFVEVFADLPAVAVKVDGMPKDDIDEITPGTVDDEDSTVTFADQTNATSYGLVDEIASRVIRSGGRVLGVRKRRYPRGQVTGRDLARCGLSLARYQSQSSR